MNDIREEYHKRDNRHIPPKELILDEVENSNSDGSPRMKITIPREQYISGIDNWHLKRFYNNE
jgi:hypothetical protein